MTNLITGGTGASMYPSQIVDAICGQSILTPQIVIQSTTSISFPRYGNIAYLLQLNQDCDITIENIPGLQFQKIILILQQSGAGNSYPTFSNAIDWDGGKKPFINIEPAKETILEIVGFNGGLKGKKLYG